MKSKADFGGMSDFQLFFTLFTVRLYSLFLSIRSVTDITVYFFVTFVFSMLAELILRKVKIRGAVSFLLFLSAMLLTVQSLVSYISFINEAVHPDFSGILLIILTVSAIIYSVSLKSNALARFSSFCCILIIVSVVTVLLSNIKNFHIDYITSTDFKPSFNMYSLIKCLDTPIMYMAFSSKDSGNSFKALKLSVAASYAFIGVIMLFVICICGTAESYYSYPVYTLFRLAGIGTLTRLDILFTSSTLFALLFKCTALTDAGLIFFKRGKR